MSQPHHDPNAQQQQNMNAMWTHHLPLIKRLYIDEKKTLKDVQQILEGEYRFPQSTLSSYETKLRDDLGLRKKMKKKDWVVVHQYVKSRGIQRFDLKLNEVVIPWLKAWKEIRRSGALQRTNTATHGNLSLPRGVTIIPRQEATISASTLTLPVASDSILMPSSTSSIVPFHALMSPLESVGIVAQENTIATLPAMIHSLGVQTSRSTWVELVIETLPWHEYRLQSLAFLEGNTALSTQYRMMNGINYALMPDDGFFRNTIRAGVCKISDSLYPGHWDLRGTHIASHALATNFDMYHYLATLIYVVSNSLDRYYEDSFALADLFDIILHRLPPSIVKALLKAKSLSLRAIWDRLLVVASSRIPTYSSSDTIDTIHCLFIFLAGLILRICPEWLDESKNKALNVAVHTGNPVLVKDLLACGADPVIFFGAAHGYLNSRSNVYGREDFNFDNLVQFGNDAVLILKTLIENHRISDAGGAWGQPFSLNFSFIMHLECVMKRLESEGIPHKASMRGESEADIWMQTLDMFLLAGANVDAPIDTIDTTYPSWWQPPKLSRYHHEIQTSLELSPTYLDFAFYCNKALFDRLVPYSTRSSSLLSRSGVCLAVIKGKQNFAQYLESVPTYSRTQKKEFVELVLAEMFFLNSHSFQACAEFARALISSHVVVKETLFHDLSLEGVEVSMLHRVVRHIQECGLQESVLFILDHMLAQTTNIYGTLTSDVLEAAVEETGTRILRTLADYGAMYSTACDSAIACNGAAALKEAAAYVNYEAVDWLLQMGVDINSEITIFTEGYSTIGYHLIGAITTSWRAPITKKPLWPICRYLLDKGALPRLQVSDENWYRLLDGILKYPVFYHIDDLWPVEDIVSFLDYAEKLDEISQMQWNDLLLKFLDYCRIRHPGGVPDVFNTRFWRHHIPGHPILAAAIAARCRPDFVQKLIKDGQDINEYSNGLTPLQAAARKADFDLVRQLLNLGANVNAARASAKDGLTGPALAAICDWNVLSNEEKERKRAIIQLLINSGAHVNTEEEEGYNKALHGCVFTADLENTILLLQLGADPNAYAPPDYWYDTLHLALDFAAEYGRLEIAQCLLKMGGLSGTPGETGYDGAILMANDRGHHAIADLIQRHIVHNEEQFALLPEMREKHARLVEEVGLKAARYDAASEERMKGEEADANSLDVA